MKQRGPETRRSSVKSKQRIDKWWAYTWWRGIFFSTVFKAELHCFRYFPFMRRNEMLEVPWEVTRDHQGECPVLVIRAEHTGMASRGGHLEREGEAPRRGTDSDGTPGGHRHRVGGRQWGKYNQKPSCSWKQAESEIGLKNVKGKDKRKTTEPGRKWEQREKTRLWNPPGKISELLTPYLSLQWIFGGFDLLPEAHYVK